MMFQGLRSRLEQFPFLKQFIKFCIVGGVAAIISFSIYFSFTVFIGFWYVYSAVYGFIISSVFNFSANKLWTFRNKAGGVQIFSQLGKFMMVVITGLLINTIILYSLTDVVGIHWLLSWLVAGGVVVFWNFGFNRLWTFKHRSHVQLSPDES